MGMDIRIAALNTRSVDAVVELFLRNAQTSYISHSELMYGRADSPSAWSPGLKDALSQEFGTRAASDDPGQATICAYREGALAGVALVEFTMDVPHPFLVVEDIVVDRRHQKEGIGQAMMAWIRQEALTRGCERMYLESGLDNDDAHHFFEHQGFRQVSIVMMADLGD